MPPISKALESEKAAEGLITFAAAARLAKCSRARLERWLAEGKITGATVGDFDFILRSTLEHFMAEKKIDNSRRTLPQTSQG